MPVSNISIAERQPPHMGPVARGFAALGDMAERAVSTVAAIAADAAQAPSRLGHAGALLTGDGQLGSLWQVMAPFSGLLLGAAGVAIVVHRLLQPQRRALAALRPAKPVPFALALLHSLVVDIAPVAAYAGFAAGGSFLLFWDRGLVFSGTETFQKVVSLIISTSVVAWLLVVVLSLPLAVSRPGLRCVPLGDREAATIRRFIGRIGAVSWMIVVSLYLSWVGDGLPRLVLVVVGLVICAMSLRALARTRSRFSGLAEWLFLHRRRAAQRYERRGLRGSIAARQGAVSCLAYVTPCSSEIRKRGATPDRRPRSASAPSGSADGSRQNDADTRRCRHA